MVGLACAAVTSIGSARASCFENDDLHRVCTLQEHPLQKKRMNPDLFLHHDGLKTGYSSLANRLRAAAMLITVLRIFQRRQSGAD